MGEISIGDKNMFHITDNHDIGYAKGERYVGTVLSRDHRTRLHVRAEGMPLAPKPAVFSDEWQAYRDLDPNLYDHGVVYHKKGAYVIGDRHTNTIEGFWGHLKKALKGVHHWVSRKHPQRYVDSSAFRYNTKHLSECGRFDVLSRNIGHRLRYSRLKNVAA